MINKRNLFGAGLAAVMLMAPQAVFAAGFANTAHSATSSGMAGVATANPDEPNSNFYNPASMTLRDQWNVYVGDTFIAPSVSYDSPDGTIESQTVSQVFFPPNLNISVPFADDFAAGVGMTFSWGLGIEWPDDWLGRETFRAQSLQTLNVNPSVAYSVGDTGLSVGAGAQFLFTSLTQEQTTILRSDREVDVMLGGTGNGFGATFGAMYQATDEITVGLNYRSAVRLNVDGRAHFSEDVNGTPFEQRMVDQDISTSLTVPHTINAGLGWQVLEPLWLGFDINYMTWSVYDQLEVEFSEQSPEGEPGETEPPLVIDADWEDAVALRIGGQYDLHDQLRGRLGFAVDMTPVPDETVSPSLPDNNRFVFSGGLGYNYYAFRADLAYQYVYLPERVIDNGTVDGTYQLSSHLVGLNVGYGF